MYGEKQRINEQFLLCGVVAAVAAMIMYVIIDGRDERIEQRRAAFNREAPMMSISPDGKTLIVANAEVVCDKAIDIPHDRIGERIVLGRKYVMVPRTHNRYRRVPTDIIILSDHDKHIVGRFSSIGCKVQKTRKVEW